MRMPRTTELKAGGAQRVEDAVSRSVWRTLTGTPGLERLYAGYYVAVADTVARHGEELLTAARRRGDHAVVERLEVELAGDIVCHLGRQVRNIPVLNLIARDLPAAIDAALVLGRGRAEG